MPESQRCYPAPPEVSYGNHRQAGWGGLQVSQHLGEWYQGRQYLPDYQAGRVRANAAAGALPASGLAAYVTKYGYFDLGAALLRRRLFRLFIGVFVRRRSLFGSFCAGTAPRTAPTRLFRAASPA